MLLKRYLLFVILTLLLAGLWTVLIWKSQFGIHDEQLGTYDFAHHEQSVLINRVKEVSDISNTASQLLSESLAQSETLARNGSNRTQHEIRIRLLETRKKSNHTEILDLLPALQNMQELESKKDHAATITRLSPSAPVAHSTSEVELRTNHEQPKGMKCKDISPINAVPEVACAPNDQESSWGPVLRHNLARMAAEDGKPGEETRSFMFRTNSEAMVSGECGAGCVEISIEQHRAAYSDSVVCNGLARTIPDDRFCSLVIFHTFWGTLPVNPHIPLYILSYLITQDLEYSQLWIWSRNGVELGKDPLLAPFVGHPNVQFRQFNGIEIIRSLNSTAIPENLIEAKDGMYWLESDLFRVLVLYAFGGVYTDMDFLYLRNFGPLLGREWFYQWGSHCVDMNGAVMRLFAKSPLGHALLEHIVSVPPQGGTTAWGRDTYRAVDQKMKILRYPTCFFNPTWLTGHDIYGGGTHRNSWHGAFGIHLHGPVFTKGPTAAADSDYVGMSREMCEYCKRKHGGGLPGMNSVSLSQSLRMTC